MAQTEFASTTVTAGTMGQVIIPAAFLNELGITEGTTLRVMVVGRELRLQPVGVADSAQGSSWLRDLYAYFAPVRDEATEKGYSDEQINEWIDEAVAGLRRDQRG